MTHLVEQVSDGADDGGGEAINHNVGEVVHIRLPGGDTLVDLTRVDMVIAAFENGM
jgi:hypothetical protein